MQNFLKLKTDLEIMSSRKKELEKRMDAFLTCNYQGAMNEKKKVRAVIYKTRVTFFPDLQLGGKKY